MGLAVDFAGDFVLEYRRGACHGYAVGLAVNIDVGLEVNILVGLAVYSVIGLTRTSHGA